MPDPRFSNSEFPIKIGANEFGASMLSDKDYGDLNGYIQAKYIEVAQNVGKEIENGRELLKFALASAVNITWGTEEGNEIINKPEGWLRLGWQMVRRRHPELSFKEFREIAGKNPDTANEAITNIALAYQHLHRSNGENGAAQSGDSKSTDSVS